MSLLWKRLMRYPCNSADRCQTLHCFLLRNIRKCVSPPVSSGFVNTTNSEEVFLKASFEDDEKSRKKFSVLEELPALEDISHVGPAIDYKSFNFAAFANECVVLQKLIDLGVDFYYVERRNKILPSYLLQLDFHRHISPYIQFLVEQGLPIDELGTFFSKNPFFFQNNLNDLQVRRNYLQSKKFTDEMINYMLIKNPRLLNFSTIFIDSKLGFLQKKFNLKGFEVRYLASKFPKLITLPQKLMAPIIFDLQEVIGFSKEESKEIILKQPYALTLKRDQLKCRLDFMTVDMELPLSLVAADPSGLVNRLPRLRERHLFLTSLRKAQYDPSKPNYVSIKSITHGDDATFCQLVAKTSVETFNLFLKSL